jgi:2-polyprenyl-3-methyl-5-hydroxy-6-metoxy-1,4-benzoquinol methylase
MNHAYYKNVRHDVLALIPNRQFNRVLEIGGGEFPTLKSFSNSKLTELWGVDLYDSNVNEIKFIKGSIEEQSTQNQIPDEYFDLIMANDVLEHLLDTQSALKVVYNKLQKGGLFVCSVPNIRQIRAFYHIMVKGRFPRNDAGLFDKTHIRWFCRDDVLLFAKQENFKLLDFGSSGRMVPSWMQKSRFAELLALQNLFVFIKE